MFRVLMHLGSLQCFTKFSLQGHGACGRTVDHFPCGEDPHGPNVDPSIIHLAMAESGDSAVSAVQRQEPPSHPEKVTSPKNTCYQSGRCSPPLAATM